MPQRLIYNCLKQKECPVFEFTIRGDFQKSCLFSSQRYKSDLEKINSNKKNADISLKQSAKLQEIKVMKPKKAKLQESVDFLRKQAEAGMINADNNQDLSALSVATACFQDARKNEKTVCDRRSPRTFGTGI